MKHNYEMKPLFVERMKELLGKENFGRYKKSVETPELRSIRVNTLKISVSDLKKRLEEKSWIIKQPFKENPEIFVIEGKIIGKNNVSENVIENKNNNSNNKKLKGYRNYGVKTKFEERGSISNSLGVGEQLRERNLSIQKRAGLRVGRGIGRRGEITDLEPGELGRSLEHLLGYYYIQEIASMLPALVLNPKPNELVLDLCASPGSKTTQMASMMKNLGVLIANEIKLDRIKILASNLERCGITNTIITRKDGVTLCERLKKKDFKFDKILVDAPCSGEGTIKSSPKTLLMWNINTIKSLSKLQKKLLEAAIEILKPKGEIVYSTCTHAPEENEGVLNYVLNKFSGKIKIEKIILPVKCTHGILGWAGGNYNKEVEKSCRIYPHITNTEGFFIAKMRKEK
ncbi:RsmB/NOP family class I SAM-dependent RNA methyltransferase [Candidatus Pacearchaeota archaeon]|nr:RsmB/NOP family class I SAM-dependent RNA methyltransferase [Candidatus Pacearchaeota archaeon]